MLKRILSCAFALMALGLLSRSAHAKVLTIGDPAPSITVKKFVKGTPVTGFEKGKLYVVEFWATWCGPCRMSIPHLTELQKKYKDVTFIGVSVFESDQKAVEPFVKDMGDKMDYRVAMDDVPEGASRDKGKMAVNWMEAAQQDGIPTAFVINKESKIAWIGHPMEMEEPLGKIVSGDWDLKAAADKIQKAQAQKAELNDLNAKLGPPMQAKDFAKALDVVDASLKSAPDLEEVVGPFKLNLLIMLKKDDAAATYGSKLIDGIFKDNGQALNAVAWNLVNPDKPRPSAALADLAVKAATRADELSKGKDPAIADTLGAAYFAQGKIDKAIETEERAVKLAKDTPMEADLNKNLLKFRQAKK